MPSRYATSLADGYTRLAHYEAQSGRVAEAHYFADKADRALAGMPLPPEKPRLDVLPVKDGQRLNDAYGRLSQLVDAGADKTMPTIVAELQTSYECWLSAQDRRFALSASRCEQTYLRALKKADAGMAPVTHTLTMIPVVPVYVIPTADNDPAARTAQNETFDSIVQDYHRFRPARVIVTAGPNAATITAALVQRGIPQAIVRVAQAARRRAHQNTSVEFRF